MTTRLTRAQAAAHLQSLGYKMSRQTLANRQVMGTGPTWHSKGWRSGYYEREELEVWAWKNLRKPGAPLKRRRRND